MTKQEINARLSELDVLLADLEVLAPDVFLVDNVVSGVMQEASTNTIHTDQAQFELGD